MSDVIIFTPPQCGLVAYCDMGKTWYGIYLGVSGSTLRLFAPTRGEVEIDLANTNDYYTTILEWDHRLLVQLGRKWCAGVVVEYLGQRYDVTDIRRRWPAFNNDILVHCRDGGEFVITDPNLKFVSHVELKT